MLYLLILSTAINEGIHATVLINMMKSTMVDITKWDSQEKDSKALLCMLGLGSGEIIGSLIMGRIQDIFSHKNTVYLNIFATTLGYACLILYAAVYDFSFYLAILMTFTFGVQDGGMNCLLNVMLGF